MFYRGFHGSKQILNETGWQLFQVAEQD